MKDGSNGIAQSLAAIGADPRLRDDMLALLRRVERRLARRDFDVREQATGVLIDALHAGCGPLRKRLRSGIEFHFHYRSKIARDFVMSPDPEPDHVWEPQTTKLLLHLGAGAGQVVVGGAYSGDQAILLAQARASWSSATNRSARHSGEARSMGRSSLRNRTRRSPSWARATAVST